MQINFENISSLKKWLERKNFEMGSPEQYDKWLQQYFEEGNLISVNEEIYDYWSCWELL